MANNSGVAFSLLFSIESEIPIRFCCDQGASSALLLRFYCALAVSATIRVILTKISNLSGIAVQWNGGLKDKLDSDSCNRKNVFP